jgi:hypothetical protein
VYLQRVRDHIAKRARQTARAGTPSFFVDGKIQDVSFDLQRLFKAVEAALRK